MMGLPGYLIFLFEESGIHSIVMEEVFDCSRITSSTNPMRRNWKGCRDCCAVGYDFCVVPSAERLLGLPNIGSVLQVNPTLMFKLQVLPDLVIAVSMCHQRIKTTYT